MTFQLVSIVIPVRNEHEAIPLLLERLSAMLASATYQVEFVFVNDGSTDSTLETLTRMRVSDPRIACVDLSRGFGKEIALTAGLQFASGDAVIMMDADLQDPPELIPQFVDLWQQGFDVVYGTRTERTGESLLQRTTAFLFYRLIAKTSDIQIPRDTGDFRLLSRRAVTALLDLPEHHRYMKGLFAWIGFPQTSVKYSRRPRSRGASKFSYWRRWELAVEGITSFSTVPLKLATYFGLFIATTSFVYALVVVWMTLLHGNDVKGYPSLMTVILFLGGVQLMAIGVLGEYLGRVFNETKQRPLFLTRQFLPSRSTRANPSIAETKGQQR